MSDISDWGKAIDGRLLDRWPKNDDGEFEEPAFLCRCANLDMSDELRVNMLEAYGVPCLRAYPGDGAFGHLVLGISGQGVDIFVPKSLYDDAVALCDESSVFEEENDE